MSLRQSMRALCALTGALVIAACSGDGGGQDAGAEAGSCASLSCEGCCRSGQCFPGDTVAACGKSGGACQTCLPGYGCISGRCAFAPKDGGDCRSSCPGCCLQPENICMPGALDEACGRGGQPCASCPPPAKCTQGMCFGAEPGSCGAGCAGCCAGDHCQPGNQPTACGIGGAACMVCAAGQRCSDGGCAGTKCGPGTCRGCCSATGACLAGTLPNACGAGGVACKMCQTDETCLSGQCSR